MTGGRSRIEEHVADEDFLRAGDGLSDVNIEQLAQHHQNHGKLATVTAVMPPGRFGALELENDRVLGFLEKPTDGKGFISGGYFVLSPKVLRLIEDDATVFETGPLPYLAYIDEIRAFQHYGFWQPMDTLREMNHLNELWENGSPPWRVWTQ